MEETVAERRRWIARLIERREDRDSVELIGPFVLGPPTLWVYPLLVAVRRLAAHLDDYRERIAWLRAPEGQPAEQAAFFRSTDRAGDTRGLPVGVAFAAVSILAALLEIARVALLAASGQDVRFTALGITRSADMTVLVLVAASCAIGAALLVSLWWVYARLRRHEENALIGSLLAARADAARARVRLEALRLRWMLIQVAAGAYTLVVIAVGGIGAVTVVPFFSAAPLVFFPLVLLWPLHTHLHHGCPDSPIDA